MVRLITGAGGMMGSHLYEAIKEEWSNEVVIPTYYNSTLDERDSISQEMEPMNITDYYRVREVLGDLRPNVIYHLAAQSRPDVSFKDPYTTYRTNILGTTTILNVLVELRIECMFINASSSAVYGFNGWKIPLSEGSPCNPLSPYGTSKLAQEHVIKNFHQMYGPNINYVNARIFNCTGPRKINDFVSDVCRRVVNEEFPLKVGNLDTERSIVDVRDLVKGLIACEKKILYSKNQTINLGSDVSHKIGDVLKLIAGDTPYEVDESLFRPTDEPIILGNISKAKDILGWKPEISLEQTISDTLDYWRNL